MIGYLIGAAALVRTEPHGSIAPAALHAQTEAGLAASIRAAVIDFEGSQLAQLSQLVLLAPGWGAQRFAAAITVPLVGRGACSLAEVMAHLARAADARVVHVFARWTPDEALVAALERFGVEVVAHPLESILQSALVSGQTYTRWPATLRAA